MGVDLVSQSLNSPTRLTRSAHRVEGNSKATRTRPLFLSCRLFDHRFLPRQLSYQLLALQDANLDARFSLHIGGKGLKRGLIKDGHPPQRAAKYDEGRADLLGRRNQLRP
jgi:hypothetical protein